MQLPETQHLEHLAETAVREHRYEEAIAVLQRLLGKIAPASTTAVPSDSGHSRAIVSPTRTEIVSLGPPNAEDDELLGD